MTKLKAIYGIACAVAVVAVVSLIISSYLNKNKCDSDFNCYTKPAQDDYNAKIKEFNKVKYELANQELELAKVKIKWYEAHGKLNNDEQIIDYKRLIDKLPELEDKVATLKSELDKSIPIAQASELITGYELIIDGNKVYAIRQSDMGYATRNREEIAKLTSDMQWRVEVFMNRLTAAGIKDIVITDGLRNNDEQKYLYSIGRTVRTNLRTVTPIPDCKPENGSKHCIGEAIDIVQFKNGKPDYQGTPWEQINKLGEDLFVWGGNWESIDRPHFQLKDKIQSSQEDLDKIAKINTYIANYVRADHAKLDNTGDVWVKYQNEFKVKAEVAVCIAVADTSLGHSVATYYNKETKKYEKCENNFGNYGNTASSRHCPVPSVEEGIKLIYIALTNESLGNKQTVGSLSLGGGGTEPIYASSGYNWNKNLISCLNTMGYQADKNYNIRIN